MEDWGRSLVGLQKFQLRETRSGFGNDTDTYYIAVHDSGQLALENGPAANIIVNAFCYNFQTRGPKRERESFSFDILKRQGLIPNLNLVLKTITSATNTFETASYIKFNDYIWDSAFDFQKERLKINRAMAQNHEVLFGSRFRIGQWEQDPIPDMRFTEDEAVTNRHFISLDAALADLQEQE